MVGFVESDINTGVFNTVFPLACGLQPTRVMMTIPRPERTVCCLLISVLVHAAMVWNPEYAFAAKRYHVGDSLICNECHMKETFGRETPSGDGMSNDAFSLMKIDVNKLCLSCHDGQHQGGAGNAPDVMGDAYPAFDQRAGSFQAAPGIQSSTSHDLGVPSQVAPGSMDLRSSLYVTDAVTGMTCVSCHDPHGNSNFANLKMDPNPNSAIVNPIVVDPTRDVILTINNETDNIPNIKHNMNNVRYANGRISEFCADCHADFHYRQGSDSTTGDANAIGNAWHRHPTGRMTADIETGVVSGVNMAVGNSNGHVNLERWMTLSSHVPVADPAGDGRGSGDDYPICLTCHKAHGTGHESSTLWDSGTNIDQDDGLSVDETCRQCHTP